VLLALGDHTFDVSHRAVVVGVLASESYEMMSGTSLDTLVQEAEELVARGADVLDVGPLGGASDAGDLRSLDLTVTAVEAVATHFDLPIAVTVCAGVEPGSIDLADLAGAGADVVRGSPDLAGAAALGLSVVLGSQDDLPAAQAAGLGRERIVLDAGLATAATVATAAEHGELLNNVDRLVATGCAVLLDVPLELPVVAAWASGLARGCRVLRTPDVRAARRTADVLAAILSARSDARP
jgi:dihydropteroate synthase